MTVFLTMTVRGVLRALVAAALFPSADAFGWKGMAASAASLRTDGGVFSISDNAINVKPAAPAADAVYVVAVGGKSVLLDATADGEKRAAFLTSAQVSHHRRRHHCHQATAATAATAITTTTAHGRPGRADGRGGGRCALYRQGRLLRRKDPRRGRW